MSVLRFIDRLEALPLAARIAIAWLVCLVPRALAAAQLGLVGDYLVFADPSARPESYWYPLYRALAKALWACSGGSVPVYAGWHLALHSLVGPLVHGSCKRLGLSGATCWFAVVGVALLPYYVSLSARQPQVGVVITLVALCLWAFLGWRDSGFGWRGTLGFALLALLSTLLRPNLLLSLGAFWAVALLETVRVPTRRPSAAVRVLASGAMVAGILLGFAAASKARTGHWSPFEPIAGYNLWIGNNEHTGQYLRRWDIVSLEDIARFHSPQGIPIEDKYERDQAFGNLAIEFARTHPRETVVNTFLKAGRYWDFRLEDSDKNPAHWNLVYTGPYLACVLLGLLGAYRMARRGNREALLLIVLLLVSYCLPHLVFHPAVRFRMTTEFALIVLAAEGLTGMVARRHGGGRHRLAL